MGNSRQPSDPVWVFPLSNRSSLFALSSIVVYNNNNNELGLSVVLSPRCVAPGVHAQSGFSAFGRSHVLNWHELVYTGYGTFQ